MPASGYLICALHSEPCLTPSHPVSPPVPARGDPPDSISAGEPSKAITGHSTRTRTSAEPPLSLNMDCFSRNVYLMRSRGSGNIQHVSDSYSESDLSLKMRQNINYNQQQQQHHDVIFSVFGHIFIKN